MLLLLSAAINQPDSMSSCLDKQLNGGIDSSSSYRRDRLCGSSGIDTTAKVTYSMRLLQPAIYQPVAFIDSLHGRGIDTRTERYCLGGGIVIEENREISDHGTRGEILQRVDNDRRCCKVKSYCRRCRNNERRSFGGNRTGCSSSSSLQYLLAIHRYKITLLLMYGKIIIIINLSFN